MNWALGDGLSGFTLAIPTLGEVWNSYCAILGGLASRLANLQTVGSPYKLNKQKNAYFIKNYLFLLIEIAIIRVTP